MLVLAKKLQYPLGSTMVSGNLTQVNCNPFRYIPERLAGATLWAPVGSLHWPGLTSQERADIWREIPGDSKVSEPGIL